MINCLPASPAGSTRKIRGRAWLPALAIAVALPLSAFALYWAAGSPASSHPQGAGAQATVPDGHPHMAASLDVLAERLAQRLQREPGDGEGWALLARTYVVLERNQEAADAYRRAVALLPADVQLRVELSQLAQSASALQLTGSPRAQPARAR